MKKNLKKLSVSNFLCLLLFSILGCSGNTIDLREPEFAVSTPVYKNSIEDNRCLLGGVYFDLYNKSETDIVFIEIRMNVFDKETGKNAFMGYGTIISENEVNIRAGEIRNMCVSLDQYITVSSEAGYNIDQFYISRLEYSDGRVWKDELGVYAVGSRE